MLDDDDDSFLRAVAALPVVTRYESHEGTTIGQYRIERRLGAGGMGIVYEALDLRLRRSVALKVLPPDLVAREERRVRFVREARLAAATPHPNIAAIYDVGETDGCVYLAMELVGGTTLRGVLERGRMDARSVMRIGGAIANGLASAHAHGIIHRDLKPENVMVDGDTVKILDFGVAKLRESAPFSSEGPTVSAVATEEGRIIGTPAYMSPEQSTGKTVDEKSDVFTLGVVLYEMVTGVRPFRGDTPMETIVAINSEVPRAPSRLASIPSPLERSILTCLEKDPSKRPTARDVAGMLEGRIAIQRPWRYVLAAVVGGVALFGVVRFGLRAAGHDTSPRPTAITDLAVPKTTVPAAAVAYRAGLQSMRDNAWNLAAKHFSEALQLDPSMAAAELRLATIDYGDGNVDSMRGHVAKVVAMRENLSERDRELVEAFAPVMQRSPASKREAAERLEALTRKYPMDAELFDWLALMRMSDPANAERVAQQAIHMDEKDATARQLHAQALALQGRIDEARAELQACNAISMETTDCFYWLGHLEAAAGDCAAAERSYKQMVERDPGADPYGQDLPTIYFAEGKGLPLVRELLAQGVARVPADLNHGLRRDYLEGLNEYNLGMVEGRFEDVAVMAAKQLVTMSGDAYFSRHYDPTVWRIHAALELGDANAARDAASSFLSKRDAWVTTENASRGLDMSPSFLHFDVAAGVLSAREYDVRRADWIGARKASDAHAGLVWVFGWALPAATREEAERALSEQAKYEPLLDSLSGIGWNAKRNYGVTSDCALGRLLVMAQRWGEALVPLRRATRSCSTLEQAFELTRAERDLGEALEHSGDKDGACHAYSVVLKRWGGAPHSITAAGARSRARALGCPE